LPEDVALINSLIEDFKNVNRNLSLEFTPEKAVLLLGGTQAGKTTLLYYLHEKKLKRVKNS